MIHPANKLQNNGDKWCTVLINVSSFVFKWETFGMTMDEGLIEPFSRNIIVYSKILDPTYDNLQYNIALNNG